MFARIITRIGSVLAAVLLGSVLTACGSETPQLIDGQIASVDGPVNSTEQQIVTITIGDDTTPYIIGPDVHKGAKLNIGDRIILTWEQASGTSRRVTQIGALIASPRSTLVGAQS